MLEGDFVGPLPMIASFHVCNIIIHSIMDAPFGGVLFTSVPVNQVIFTSMHRSVDMKRKICQSPSMKTAISHSKLIKQKEFTEKRFLKGVVTFVPVP
jgi:hypothetical protein